jgi:S1-C subfamily serine protease
LTVSEDDEWAIPEGVQPKPEECAFDLDRTLSSVVSVRAEVPPDAFTASVLGTERAGHGVVIHESGLVVTIGYLITEAETLWLVTNAGTAAAAHVVGYDQTTGFGLVQALGQLGVPAMDLGSSRDVEIGSDVIIAGQGGRPQALAATVISKREFAGYWEYVLDEAILTAPPHPNWGGAACIGPDGRLEGIGSLLVQESDGERSIDGNMIVPIDLLPPILEDLLRFGRVQTPARPWLGMYTADGPEAVVVVGLASGGPADLAGVHVGDVVLAVGGMSVGSLADTFRKVWALGAAGVDVPLTLIRDGRELELSLRSADRNDFLKHASLH